MNFIYAFILRDLQIEKSYRFNLLIKVFAILFQLAIFYFISEFIAKPEYFYFVFIGLMFSRFFQFWLNIFSENIIQEQYWGTAELLFLSPHKTLFVILASLSGKLLILFLELFVYLLFGEFFFSIHLFSSFWKILPFLSLNSITFAGFGLISASFVMYFKRGDPINWFITNTFDLLSGVYFPILVLPKSLRYISEFLPTTSALDGWRDIVLLNTSISYSQIITQVLWAIITFLLGIISFNIAIQKTKTKGELGNY